MANITRVYVIWKRKLYYVVCKTAKVSFLEQKLQNILETSWFSHFGLIYGDMMGRNF